MPANLSLNVLANNQVTQLNLDQVQTIAAQPNSVITVVDTTTGMLPDDLVLKRVGDDLVIEVDQQVVARVEDFYADGMSSTFSLDGSLTPADGMYIASADAPAMDPGTDSQVVWEASSSHHSIDAAVLGAVGIGAGIAVAAASGSGNSGDTTAPVAPPTPSLVAAGGGSSSSNITNDTTPTFSGTAEPNSTVTLVSSVDGTIGTATADSSGHWSITASALSEGAHNITVTATDAAGNTSTASSALAITIDATAPSVPSIPDLLAASDTGSSATDNITNDTTPTFTGTAEANSTITVISSVDGTLGTTTADGSGNWSFTASTLSEGAHNITATATDTAGNTSSASSALAITIDATAPSAPSTPDLAAASDTGSFSSDDITSDTTPTFSGTAEANSTVTVISSVDGTLGTATADGSGNWSYTPGSALTTGAHNISATATDTAGNTSSASSALAITIDATAPSAPSTPDLAAASDSGSSSTDNITSDTTPTFSGTAEANSTVTVISSVDGTLGTATADGSGNWSYAPGSALTTGAHNITATATDTAGNTSSASSALAITIDASAPSAPSTPDLVAASDTGISSSDNITSDTIPTFSGTAEANSTVTVISSVDGTLGTTTADGSGNWSYTAGSALTSGAHNITATATDTAGNTSSASSALAITIDATAPSAPSTPDLAAASDSGSSTTDNITSDTTPTFTGTAEANSTVTLSSSVDGTLGTTTADGSGNWSFTASSALTEGAHSITATATDTAGNTSSASSALAITIDTTAPTTTISGIDISTDSGSSASDFITNTASQTITGTLSAGLASDEILYGSTDGGSTWTDVTSMVSGTAISWTGAALSGSSSIQFKVTDDAGNDGTVASQAYTLDTSAPSAPSTPDLAASSDSGSSSTDDITNDTTPTFSGTAEANSTVTVISSVDGTLGTTTADGSGNWSFTAGSALTETTHNITATATDTAGNTSSASSALAITIDTTAPSAPSTPDLAASSDTGNSSTDNLTRDTTPSFSGTAEANATITLISSVDGTVGTGTADGSGNWSITASTLSTGAHNITATATDTAGNTSTASSALSITIDTTVSAPSTPDLTAASDSGSSSTDNITNDTTPTFTGTAEANATVTLLGGGTIIGTGTADGSGNWSITTSTLSGAAYDITARATDAAGNTSATSSALAITIDDMVPSTSSPDLAAASDTGFSDTDHITNDTTPTFTGIADPNTTITLVSSVDGVIGTTTADGSTGDWSITASTLSEGAHDITATATDTAGNSSGASPALAITIDATAPSAPSTPDLAAASDTGSSSTDNITSDTTPTFNGTAEANSTVTVISSVDGTLGTTTADGSGNWSYTAGSALTEGAHSITATATDIAGNTGSASAALAITIDTSAPAAPSAPDMTAATDSGSSNTDNLTNDTTPTFTGTAEANATVALVSSVDGTVGTTTADGSGNWSITASTLTSGAHNITATATDAAGNTSTASSALVVNIDASAPAAPSAPDMTAGTDTGSSSTDNITSDTTPTFTGTAEANSTVTVISSVDGTIGTTTADGSGNWTYTAGSALTAGAHNITATATDAAGNTGSASSALGITIDTSAPTLSSSTPADNATGVSLTSDIVLNFNENIHLGSGNIVISDGSQTITIDVASHGGQLSVSGSQLTINPTADLANNSSDYNVQIASTAITDTAGNTYAGIADTTTLDFTTVSAGPDTSIVVFDTTADASSTHSSQTFSAGVAYTIYVIVAPTTLAPSWTDFGSQEWKGGQNLGADDTITLVSSNGSPVQGYHNNSVSRSVQYSAGTIVNLAWATGTNSHNSGAAWVVDGGGFTRGYGTGYSVNWHLWRCTGTATHANWVGANAPSQNYLLTMPAGVMTSQGL